MKQKTGFLSEMRHEEGLIEFEIASFPCQKPITNLNTIAKTGTAIRKGSHVSVVFVTDAADQGPVSARELLFSLADATGSIKDITIHGLFWTEELGCKANGEAPMDYPHSSFRDLIEITGGTAGALCMPKVFDSVKALNAKL